MPDTFYGFRRREARARFFGSEGSFEASCEVNRKMLKSGMDPAIFMR